MNIFINFLQSQYSVRTCSYVSNLPSLIRLLCTITKLSINSVTITAPALHSLEAVFIFTAFSEL